MDILIDRLYRTRVQVGYEPQERRHEAPARTDRASYAYVGGDTAELSPLSIVFYTSARNSDGTFLDLSEKFSQSPFSRELGDYGAQFKKNTILQEPVEKVYRNETSAAKQKLWTTPETISETLDITPGEASDLLRLGEIARNAYQHAGAYDAGQVTQRMINVNA